MKQSPEMNEEKPELALYKWVTTPMTAQGKNEKRKRTCCNFN